MTTTDAKASWICPMCPGVESEGPGACPHCGMALEPAVPVAGEEDRSELDDMEGRLGYALILSVPVVVLAMWTHLPGIEHPLLEPSISRWFEAILTTGVVLWCGEPFLQRSWTSFATRRLNMFSLIGLGVMAAWLWSLAALLLPGWFPAALRAEAGVGVYFESAAVIVTLVLVGQVLELRARGRTGAAIRELLALAPETALRVTASGEDEEVSIASLQAGDRLRVLPGGRVPVDGELVEGTPALDESMLTGEPIPRSKAPGDPVFGGSINTTSAFVMRAVYVGPDTLLARVVAMVAEAQRSRAPIQRVADAVAGWFVPAVVAVALLAFGLWWLVGPPPQLSHAVTAAVAVLIVACPCALGLATPMSIMVATGRGARGGILFRDAEAIERLCEIDTLVVDKTGTLTEGRPALAGVITLAGHEELLRLAASLERASEHPLGRAVVAAARERGLALAEPAEVEATPGLGVRGRVEGHRVALGSAAWLEQLGVDPAPLVERLGTLREEGQTVVFAAVDGQPAGLLGIEDPVKAGTPEAVEQLRAEGIHLLVLSGDDETTARAVASRLGIDDVVAQALPDEKAAVVERLLAEGKRVAMAGDGVNDAPALALATVGIAMGTGADVAIESAPVTLVEGDLRAIARARALSAATMRNIRQNLFFAFVYNSLGVPVAAGVLYPAFGWLLSPMLAAAAMSLSSVSVIANALRLRGARL